VEYVKSRYCGRSQNSLLRDVYARYPWYAAKTKLTEFLPATIPSAPSAPLAVYTIGYEGISVDGFFNRLLRVGIRAIIDVRANPVSRKYGFARKSLSGIAEKLGLHYRHFPQLGIASVDRAKLNGFASYQTLLDRYEREMLPRQASEVAAVARVVQAEPSALLCVEKDVRCCHRSRLAEAVARESKLEVKHLFE